MAEALKDPQVAYAAEGNTSEEITMIKKEGKKDVPGLFGLENGHAAYRSALTVAHNALAILQMDAIKYDLVVVPPVYKGPEVDNINGNYRYWQKYHAELLQKLWISKSEHQGLKNFVFQKGRDATATKALQTEILAYLNRSFSNYPDFSRAAYVLSGRIKTPDDIQALLDWYRNLCAMEARNEKFALENRRFFSKFAVNPWLNTELVVVDERDPWFAKNINAFARKNKPRVIYAFVGKLHRDGVVSILADKYQWKIISGSFLEDVREFEEYLEYLVHEDAKFSKVKKLTSDEKLRHEGVKSHISATRKKIAILKGLN